MTNPRFESISQMEANAAGEDDDTCNMRLHNERKLVWLRVVWYSTGYRYHLDANKSREITRTEAQEFINKEWGK